MEILCGYLLDKKYIDKLDEKYIDKLDDKTKVFGADIRKIPDFFHKTHIQPFHNNLNSAFWRSKKTQLQICVAPLNLFGSDLFFYLKYYFS